VPKPPTFDDVVTELGSQVISLVYRAFEDATAEAKAFFDEHGVPIEWSLHSDISRFWAKHRLQQAGHDAEFEMEDLARNGLMATFAGYPTRIRKSDNGGVPLPGNSEPYMAHLNQQTSWLRDGSVDPKWNLMTLWETDSNGLLSKLLLALTTSATETAVQCAWIREIPHPATGQGARDVGHEGPDSGQGEMPRDDLVIGEAADEDKGE